MSVKNKGFTLVELSIVLVIIGLLIGGILAAQSMISTAKIVSVSSQIQQFDAGMENFKTKYNYLPGDAPSFGGDGDGMITLGAAAGYGTAVNSYGGEILNFWGDLFSDKFATYPNTAPGAAPKPNPPGANVPLSKLGSSGSFLMASAMANTSYYITGSSYNYYAIVSQSAIRTAQTNCCFQLIGYPASTPALKAADLLALDKKFDDGNGLTGNILSNSIYDFGDGSGGISAFSNGVGICINADGTYILDNSQYKCTPIIRIGAQTSDPQ